MCFKKISFNYSARPLRVATYAAAFRLAAKKTSQIPALVTVKKPNQTTPLHRDHARVDFILCQFILAVFINGLRQQSPQGPTHWQPCSGMSSRRQQRGRRRRRAKGDGRRRRPAIIRFVRRLTAAIRPDQANLSVTTPPRASKAAASAAAAAAAAANVAETVR